MKLNGLFQEHRSTGFWNYIKSHRRLNTHSLLSTADFTGQYSKTMADDGILTESQERIKSTVEDYRNRNAEVKSNDLISHQAVRTLVANLKHGSCPGHDGISAEHLRFGESDAFYRRLAVLYTAIIQHCVVPENFTIGLIIPVLKKATLNPNSTDSYRPITLTTTHAKIVEMHLGPEDKACEHQYGFRKDRGTYLPGSIINDTLQYYKTTQTPLFICSLDAEKYFDRIWQHGLFSKLKDILPAPVWILCYRWYTALKACVK